MPQRTQTSQRQVQVQNLIMFALQVKKQRAQIRLRCRRRPESLTGHEFNSSDAVLENGHSSFSDLDLNTSISMSSDSSSSTTGSESDTNEPSDDSFLYSDTSSLGMCVISSFKLLRAVPWPCSALNCHILLSGCASFKFLRATLMVLRPCRTPDWCVISSFKVPRQR
ncbi:hypothetical protein BDR07DRAFT_126652 [Suillus spraguei]|nr:hypothetical protein BDR07DRAFT_126652 [Suillus spraguei]